MERLKVSIITVCYNSENTINDAIKSVLSQTYPEIEYIIVDGLSTDNTINIINSFGKHIFKFISEPDQGIYDALNKGIKSANGDIIGILHSDDFFYDNSIISKVADAFTNSNIDAIYGDVQFVDSNDISRIVRQYSSKNFSLAKFRYGIMPAHPTFYVRREIFERFGYYKADYKIAADFEILLRFMLINNIQCKYLNFPFVRMRTGGISNRTFLSRYLLNKEVLRACRENGIKTNYFLIYSKYLIKMWEFILL